jgi:peptidoglycan hydrolase-like protein with peptidoglycan-binding domain
MDTKRNERVLATCVALAVMALGAGCAPQQMTRADKGTAVGAGTGAVAGAVVGGPVGALVGAGVGAYAGNAAAGGPVSGNDTRASGDMDSRIARVQRALNDRGFNAGPVDGNMGPSTVDALRRFQAAAGLPVTGNADSQTMVALGV